MLSPKATRRSGRKRAWWSRGKVHRQETMERTVGRKREDAREEGMEQGEKGSGERGIQVRRTRRQGGEPGWKRRTEGG